MYLLQDGDAYISNLGKLWGLLCSENYGLYWDGNSGITRWGRRFRWPRRGCFGLGIFGYFLGEYELFRSVL